MLKENTVAKPNNQAHIPMTKAAVARPILYFSTIHATIGSAKEIAELHAAKETNTKNIVPKITPALICPKAMGNVWNRRPGPALGSKPFAKTIGKIAKPAIIATAVSKKATITTVLATDVFFGI